MVKSKLDVQFVKSITRSNLLKDKCKTKERNSFLNLSFYVYFSTNLLNLMSCLPAWSTCPRTHMSINVPTCQRCPSFST